MTDDITDIYSCMRRHSGLLGDRILQEFPALRRFVEQFHLGCRETHLRPRTSRSWEQPNEWLQASTALIVDECGTGKALIYQGPAQRQSR